MANFQVIQNHGFHRRRCFWLLGCIHRKSGKSNCITRTKECANAYTPLNTVFPHKREWAVFDESIPEIGGEFSETNAPISLGTCHPHLQCGGIWEGNKNFLNVGHVCTILSSKAHDCQLAAKCAHLHSDVKASQDSWHAKWQDWHLS